MQVNIKAGLTHKLKKIVTAEDTAEHYGSGLVPVFATPAMIALMEKAAMMCVLPHLPEGYNTVGTEVNIKHLKATPVGGTVFCEVELKVVVGRKLIFSVIAKDKNGIIGRGKHERFIIDTEKFMKNL